MNQWGQQISYSFPRQEIFDSAMSMFVRAQLLPGKSHDTPLVQSHMYRYGIFYTSAYIPDWPVQVLLLNMISMSCFILLGRKSVAKARLPPP